MNAFDIDLIRQSAMESAPASRSTAHSLDRMTALQLAKRIVIFTVDATGIAALVDKARQDIPGLTSNQMFQAVANHNPDTFWAIAKKDHFEYQRPDPPQFGVGGDAFLESTPPVMTCYQARAGQVFTQAIGVQRLRDYSLAQQRRLVSSLAERGIHATGGSADHGAFVVVTCSSDDAPRAARRGVEALAARGVIADARGPRIRLCPDVLTTTEELDLAARAVAEVLQP